MRSEREHQNHAGVRAEREHQNHAGMRAERESQNRGAMRAERESQNCGGMRAKREHQNHAGMKIRRNDRNRADRKPVSENRSNTNRSSASLKQEVFNWLFPRRCPFCHEMIQVKMEDRPEREQLPFICPDCRSYVRTHYLIREPACKRCGKALSRRESEYCMDCAGHRRSFDGGVSLFQYGRRNLPPVVGKKPGFEKHSMGESILQFKYHNRREYADYYIDELMRVYGRRFQKLYADVILPIPVHPARKRMRGYNQAEILAEKLGTALGIEVCKDLLIRVKKTRPQKELNNEERLRNLQEAFVLSKPVPRSYRTVILIDDIYTTGSTMEACTRKLKEAGVCRVYCISICSGQVPDAKIR